MPDDAELKFAKAASQGSRSLPSRDDIAASIWEARDYRKAKHGISWSEITEIVLEDPHGSWSSDYERTLRQASAVLALLRKTD